MQKSLMEFVICIHTHNTARPNPLSYRDVWWQHFLQRKPLGVRLIMMQAYVLACSTTSYEAKCSDPTLIQLWFNWNRQLHTATLPFPTTPPSLKYVHRMYVDTTLPRWSLQWCCHIHGFHMVKRLCGRPHLNYDLFCDKPVELVTYTVFIMDLQWLLHRN